MQNSFCLRVIKLQFTIHIDAVTSEQTLTSQNVIYANQIDDRNNKRVYPHRTLNVNWFRLMNQCFGHTSNPVTVTQPNSNTIAPVWRQTEAYAACTAMLWDNDAFLGQCGENKGETKTLNSCCVSVCAECGVRNWSVRSSEVRTEGEWQVVCALYAEERDKCIWCAVGWKCLPMFWLYFTWIFAYM